MFSYSLNHAHKSSLPTCRRRTCSGLPSLWLTHGDSRAAAGIIRAPTQGCPCQHWAGTGGAGPAHTWLPKAAFLVLFLLRGAAR